jgi:hypothetical protein
MIFRVKIVEVVIFIVFLGFFLISKTNFYQF